MSCQGSGSGLRPASLLSALAVILFLFLPLVPAWADCLDENPDLYRLHPQDPRYSSLAFAYCARVKKECPTALDQLEQLRYQDPPVYDYLSGVSLAAGECARRSPEQAESHLQRCARYSQACKKALLLLATLDPRGRKKYWRLANEVVRTGSVYGMLYLVEYHASLNTPRDNEQALYWLEIARVGSGTAIASLQRQVGQGRISRSQFARFQERQQKFMARLAQREVPILKKLDQATIARARANAVAWHRRNAVFFSRQRQANDPVAWIASIYNLNFALLRPAASPPAKEPFKAPARPPVQRPTEKQGKKDSPAPPPAMKKNPEKLRDYEKIIDDLVM